MMREILVTAAIVFCGLTSTVVYGQTSGPAPVSYICIEAESGIVLMEKNADLPRPPASMLKMMQMLLVEEGVRAGLWHYDMPVRVSHLAQSMGGTQVFLEAGEEWSLERLMMAIAVLSANDASVAVAEGLWGGVEQCIAAMNLRAAELGMVNTWFYSVNGLPPSDGKSFDQSTARDMAILGRALLAYPNLLEWTRMTEFQFRPDDTPRRSTNRLLKDMPGCDGLKTGYIRAAGFCLTATAQRDGIRLIAVVMGSDRNGRFTHTQQIIEEGFGMVQRVQPVRAAMPIGRNVPVARGLSDEISLLAREDIHAVVRNVDIDRLTLEVTAPRTLEAPVEAHTEVGYVRLLLDNQPLGETTLLTGRTVERKRWKHHLREMIGIN